MRVRIVFILIGCVFSMVFGQIEVEEIIIPQLNVASDKALKVDLLADNFGITTDTNNLKVQASLYWNDNSLFVKLVIKDDTITNSDNAEIFIADSRGGKNMMQFFFSGFNQKNIKCILWDFRGTRILAEMPVKYIYSSQKSKYKTTIHFQLPLNQLGKSEFINSDLGINIMVADVDAENSRKNQSVKWSNVNSTYKNSWAMVAVRLGKEKKGNIDTSLKVYWEDDSLIMIIALNLKGYVLTVKDFYSQEKVNSTHFKTTLEPRNNYEHSMVRNIYRSNQISSKISVYQADKKLGDVDLILAPKEVFNINMDNLRDEIEVFQYRESIKKPNPDILFVGHSMFRYWFTMEDDFKKFNILNRGFGGSRLENILANYEKIILPYYPKKIVLINGCNDLAFGDTHELAFSEFKTLVNKIHTDLPNTKLIVLTHPSFYYGYFKKLKEYDGLMIDYIQNSGWIQLADIRNALPANISDLHACLLPDYTHLNAKGYKLLIPIITQQLQK